MPSNRLARSIAPEPPGHLISEHPGDLHRISEPAVNLSLGGALIGYGGCRPVFRPAARPAPARQGLLPVPSAT